MRRQLGKAIGIIAGAIATEMFMHEDVRAWGAPSECHTSVRRGEYARLRRARRHAKSVSGLSRAAFNREFQRVSPRIIEHAVGRIYASRYPF